MKVLNAIIKIAVALAAVAGAVYVVATYGEEIVAWAKRLWARLESCHCCCDDCCCEDCDCDDCECDCDCDEDCCCESDTAEEPAQEAAEDATEAVADDGDFEG